MRGALEEAKAQAAADTQRAAALSAALGEADKRGREHKEREARRSAEQARLQEELEEMRRQKDEAKKEAVRAGQLVAEAKQEATSVRNELGMRLYQAQQELAEAEEGWRRALGEERAHLTLWMGSLGQSRREQRGIPGSTDAGCTVK